MKKLLLAMTALALGAGNAAAADMGAHPYKAPSPMITPFYDWSGFYYGLNGGYGWNRDCWNLQNSSVAGAVVGANQCGTAKGGVAGVQAGYRSQSSALVYGFEFQGDWAGLQRSAPSNALYVTTPGDLNDKTLVDGFALITAQVGFTFGNVLFYVKGGGAGVLTRHKEIQASTGVVAASASDSRFGGTAGAGIEFGFLPGWSIGAVYDHLFMGAQTVGFTSSGTVAGIGTAGAIIANSRIRQDIDIGTVRLNYVFGGPSISKY